MKKLLSIVLSAVMVMAMFSGLVLFNASAATTKLIHFDFINQYTNAQAALMKGAEDTTTASKDGDYVTITGLTKNDWGQRIKIDTAKGIDQWAQNALIDGINVFEGVDLSNKVGMGLKFAGADAGKIKSVNLCFGSSKKRVAVDLKTFTKNDDGYYYNAFSNCQVVGASWYYDCPTWQDTFYCTVDQCSICIYFNGVSEGTSVSVTIEDAYVEAYNDTDALAEAILEAEALGIDETSSRAVYSNCGDYTQAQIDAEVLKVKDDIMFSTLQYVQLPGVQDWTATEMETYNTVAASNNDSICGNPAEIATDHVKGAATQSVKLIMGGKPNAWSVNFSTAASTDKESVNQLGNVLGKYAKISELFKFEGIRIAVQNEAGNQPSLVTWDKENAHVVSLKLVGSDQKSWNNTWYPTAQATYYQDGVGGTAEPVYHDGYYYFYFKDLVSGWGGNFVEKYAANNWTYGNLLLHFQNGGLNNANYNGGAIYVSDMQLFRKNNHTEELTEGLWKGNYTDESWAKVEAAIADNDPAAVEAAIADLKVRATVASTANFFEGWTSQQVNDVVTANSDKLCDNIGNSLNIDGQWDGGDFTKNTVFAADGNFSMTANADFTKGTMGWKNMDRSGTLAASGKNYGYPTFDPKGLATSEGIRFKLTATGGDAKGKTPKFERLLIGLSNCADMATEMYALEIKPEYFNSQGYINIPFDSFVPAFWAPKFDATNIEKAVVLVLQAYGVPQGTTLTFSDFTGYTTVQADDLVKDIWQYNYTDASWAAVQAAIDAGDYAGTEAAIAALKLRDTVAASEDFFKGWTNAAVNAVVGVNKEKLCDNIGNSLNIDGQWDGGDFTTNTVFAAKDNFSMKANADFTGKTMGWKNMDRSGLLADKANGGYPTFDTTGLADAEGIRFKLTVSEGGSFGRLLIGLSNCADMTTEMYAVAITPDYFTADGYINIPFEAFEKAFWAPKFDSTNIEKAIVLILQAYDVTKDTTLTFSDFAGYETDHTAEILEKANALSEYNYTADSWSAFDLAKQSGVAADIIDAMNALVARPVVNVTGNFFDGWTTDAVNAVVKANDGKLCDSIGDGTNAQSVWDKGDFTNNTTFAANNSIVMTATGDFSEGSMGWKNMDRSGTLAEAGANYGYPTLNVKGLSKADAIRVKIETTGKVERLLIGLSNCTAKMTREMYALNIDPDSVDANGYLNIPLSTFVNAWWTQSFAQEELEDVVVLCVQAYGATKGSSVTLSDCKGIRFKEITDADIPNVWQYNYTADSYKAYSDAIAIAATQAQVADALALLVPANTVSTTADFFEGWTYQQVNDVVNENSGKLCDNIGNSDNAPNLWDGGDFTNNTDFAADDNFSMEATDDFTGKTMGWKNMDRSGNLAADGANYGYPAIDATGLVDAEGIRLNIAVEGGSFDRVLIGLSNCANLSREMYAVGITEDDLDDDGYINIPFSYFEKAWWGNAFEATELDQVEVLIFQVYGATEGTKVTFSDMAGYKAFKPASEDLVETFNTYLANLKTFDIDGHYTTEILDFEKIDTAKVDELVVREAAADILAILKKYKDANTGIVDVPGYSIYTQAEMDQFVGREATWKVTKTEKGATFARTSGGGYMVSNGAYGGDGYEENDTNYGAIAPINGKTFIDMLGGFKLKDIQAFRFQSTGSAYYQFMFKDNKGLWDGIATPAMNITKGDDGYYTVDVSKIPTGKLDGWYGSWTYDDIINKTQFININPTGNLGKEVYGWQVVLFDTVDRSDLATAIAAFAAEGLVADYSTEYVEALETYYDDAATQGDIDDAADTLNKILNKPDAPSLDYDEITDSSITVTAVTGCEYQIDGGAWTDNNEFTGLDANAEYTIGIRVKETDDAIASDVTEDTWTTEKGSFGNASISVSGTERYLETLTASEEDVPDYLGNYEIEWYDDDGSIRGTGSSYTLTAADIGKTIVAILVSENADDEVSSDPTGTIGKGIITGYTVPTASEIAYPQTLADSTLSGGDTGDITGDWAWADDTTRPHFDESGNDFGVVFTPDGAYADLYEIIEESVEVTVNEPDYQLITVKSASGFALTGYFVEGTEVALNAITYKDAAYLALLRASNKAESDNSQLILFYGISLTYEGEELTDLYEGTLEVSSYVGIERAGQTYDVWFFVDDAPVCYEGTVDEAGYLKVEAFALEAANIPG